MRLPRLDLAVVPMEKVAGYLLSVVHPAGRGKAVFFREHGFTAHAWPRLSEALLRHAGEHDVTQTQESRFGVKYVIEGPLQTPDGRSPVVRVVWFIPHGQEAPRLVTAYPCS